MKIMKKNFLFCVLMLLFFMGCKDNVDSINNIDTSIVMTPVENVKFVNNTDLVVNIFTDSLKTNLLTELDINESFSCKVDINTVGNVFYYSYYLKLGDLLLPYGEDVDQRQIEENKVLTINIDYPSQLYTNANVILLDNISNNAIELYETSVYETYEAKTILYPDNKSIANKFATLINPNDYGIYKLDKDIDLSSYKIKDLDLLDFTPLSENVTEGNGNIYHFTYTGNEVVFDSKTPFDLSIKDKIWKNSVSQSYGKFLTAGRIGFRENKEDGYMLWGGISASDIDDSIEGNKPYYAFINTDGSIAEEYLFSFSDNPRQTKLTHCIEQAGINIALGYNEYANKSKVSFMMSNFNGYSFYDYLKPLKEDNEEMDDKDIDSCPYGIVHVKENIFCVLLSYWNKNNNVKQYQLIEVTVENSKITKKLIYSSEENKIPCSIALKNDEYIVLYQSLNTDGTYDTSKSCITFIDRNSGKSLKTEEIEGYLFNKIKLNPNNNFLYLSGSGVSSLTPDIAALGKIDVENRTICKDEFRIFPSSNQWTSSNFYDFVFDGNNIVLCGFSGAEYSQGTNPMEPMASKDAVPYLVSYNTESKKTNWVKEYKDEKGYIVYSVDKSSIDSLFLELYNPSTSHSYIVSTGLLGEIPEETKNILPNNLSEKELEKVVGEYIDVYFYENASSIEPYKQEKLKLDMEYSLLDFKEYEPSTISSGNEVAGWYKIKSDEKKSSVESRLIVQLKPSSVPNSPDKTTDSSTNEDIQHVDGIIVFPTIFTVKEDLHLVPIITERYDHQHNFIKLWDYDTTHHWYKTDCSEHPEVARSEHTFTDWKITLNPTETTLGEKYKNCTICGYKLTKNIETVRTTILQSSPNYEIQDTGQYGLENDKNSILNLSSYSKYMNDDFVFVFDVKISYEAYYRWWEFRYEQGNKQVFLFKRNPGYVADSLNMVNSTTIRRQYGLLEEETWDEDKGTKYFKWNVNGYDCTNNMYIKYDAWGDINDTWYVKSITVDLLIKPKY